MGKEDEEYDYEIEKNHHECQDCEGWEEEEVCRQGRRVCCEERPYDDEKDGRWCHPKSSTIDTKDWFEGQQIDTKKCHVCGLEYDVRVPR